MELSVRLSDVSAPCAESWHSKTSPLRIPKCSCAAEAENFAHFTKAHHRIKQSYVVTTYTVHMRSAPQEYVLQIGGTIIGQPEQLVYLPLHVLQTARCALFV